MSGSRFADGRGRRRAPGIPAAVAVVIASVLVASPARSAFDLRASTPRERGAATRMAVGRDGETSPGGRALSSEASVYGFRPFGMPDIAFLALTCRTSLAGGGPSVSFAYERLEALGYVEQACRASVALGRPGLWVEPAVRVGRAGANDGSADHAVLLDLAIGTRLVDAVGVEADLENPLGLGLVRERSSCPQRLTLGLGLAAGDNLTCGMEVLKEGGFPVSLAMGAEWRPAGPIIFRGGARTDPQEFCLGLGTHWSWLVIDYGVSVNVDLGTTHEAGLTVVWQ